MPLPIVPYVVQHLPKTNHIHLVTSAIMTCSMCGHFCQTNGGDFVNSLRANLINSLRDVFTALQCEPGPSDYKPNHNFLKKPPSQAKKSPPFLSSAVRNDKFAVKFFTGNFVSIVTYTAE